MSDKTLVERLRDGSTANGTCTGAENGTCASVVIRNLLDKECESRYVCTTCRNCINETMNKLADAIEREYLPRPRFEDGEPVQFGDMAKVRGDLGDVIEMVYQDGKCVEVVIGFGDEETASHYTICEGERVKRPELDVLDADGVPIRVGDTVWNVNTGRCLVVEGLGERWFLAICDTMKHNPLAFSHKEPDSLERIEADAVLRSCDYFGSKFGQCEDCRAHSRLKGSCSAYQALDLLRRQREVLERDNER